MLPRELGEVFVELVFHLPGGKPELFCSVRGIGLGLGLSGDTQPFGSGGSGGRTSFPFGGVAGYEGGGFLVLGAPEGF